MCVTSDDFHRRGCHCPHARSYFQETIRIKVGQGIAGLVAQTGRFVNIKDAYKHPQFFRDMDKNTGFHTRNLLCFPIKDHQGLVVGVAELCNKIDGTLGWYVRLTSRC